MFVIHRQARVASIDLSDLKKELGSNEKVKG